MENGAKFKCALMVAAISLMSCTFASLGGGAAVASSIEKIYENAGDQPLSIEQASQLKAATHGRWPRQALVGSKAVDLFAKLVLRATVDDAFQQAMLTDAFALSGVELDRYAFARLNDSVELSHGRTQQFGSVVHFVDGEPIVDGGYELERANVLRNQVALSPLLPFLSQVKKEKSLPAEYAAGRLLSINPPRDPILRAELLTKMEADQAARMSPPSTQNALMSRSDRDAAALVKRVVAKYNGFPPAEDVAIDGIHAFFLLSQHVLDDEALASLLPQAGQLMRSEQLSRQDYALMSDRVAVYQGTPQLYGTQSELRNGQYVVSEIKDEKNVNARRAEMGLDPLPGY